MFEPFHDEKEQETQAGEELAEFLASPGGSIEIQETARNQKITNEDDRRHETWAGEDLLPPSPAL